MRRRFSSTTIGLLLLVLPLPPASRVSAQQPQPVRDEHRAYSVEFRHPAADLIRDLNETERGNRFREASVPGRQWYSTEIRRRMGSWGPKARAYPPFPGLETRSPEWLRERVIAVGLRYKGYDYQHHHIPDWNPPQGWPWKPVGSGKNGRGVDCSNFTGFVYNQGFGIQLNTNVVVQSEQRTASMADGRQWPIERIELPATYNERIQTLRTGDLLYIRGRPGGPITHVVIWVGPLGHADDDTPLILDSHGTGVLDDNGQPIPAGIQLRPFRERSWYNRCASHAHRIINAP